jgi:dTDP-4-amino-4,6-dideoxygalactose transaminase
MQAVIGCLQYEKLPKWLDIRRRNARILNDAFRDLPALRITEPPSHVEHAYYKFYAFVRPERLKESWTRDRIMVELNAKGSPCMTGVCPEIYLEGAFVNSHPEFSCHERLRTAKRLGEESLMFLVHPTLKQAHMERVADVVSAVVANATR